MIPDEAHALIREAMLGGACVDLADVESLVMLLVAGLPSSCSRCGMRAGRHAVGFTEYELEINRVRLGMKTRAVLSMRVECEACDQRGPWVPVRYGMDDAITEAIGAWDRQQVSERCDIIDSLQPGDAPRPP